ncbi:MAG: inositol monophosphatase, partial [Dehalococcoidia bacterium]
GGIVAEALEREVQVEYKAGPADARRRSSKAPAPDRDPVSEVDRAVETLLRERIGAAFPDHVIVGEENENHPAADAEYVWVVDPVDGTSNFVNGFPLFAVSIGVLRRGRPVAGAVWCATTHALGPGVYHAHEGGPLLLDGVPVTTERATKVKRTLAAAPGGASAGTPLWDHRVTGSMAVEAAYVAAGVFAAAPFWVPKIWDVAAGVVLIRAAGREVWLRTPAGWQPLERFEAPDRLPRRRGQPRPEDDRTPSLRDWRGSLLVGTAAATSAMRERARTPSIWASLRARLRGRRR